MALPTLSSRWRPLTLEKRWQNMHEHEYDHQKRWNNVVKYHSNNALRTQWSSRKNRPCDSYQDASNLLRDRSKTNIHQRRQKLAKILKDERDELEAELIRLKIQNSSAKVDTMRDRTEELKSAREEKNRKIAEKKLYEHWKMNNPDLRALESELHQEHVKETWGMQQQQKLANEMEEKENEQRFANEFEEARANALENLMKKTEERKKAEKERAEILKLQMKELEERARESEKLQKEEANLLQEQLKLEKMEEERELMKKQAEQKELGFFLHRQYKAQMRKRAREVQEELTLDKQILERIFEEQKNEDAIKSARQEKAKQDVAWMKQVMEQQLKLEKEREAELDLMYREEARQVWEKREDVWKREREAREQLVRDVLHERASQLSEKLEQNKRKQQELLKERSSLIALMEKAKKSSEDDKKLQMHAKLEQRNNLEQQVTSRREKTARQKTELMEEARAEEDAQKSYREFLKAETQRRRKIGHQPQQYGRRRVAWD